MTGAIRTHQPLTQGGTFFGLANRTDVGRHLELPGRDNPTANEIKRTRRKPPFFFGRATACQKLRSDPIAYEALTTLNPRKTANCRTYL